MKNQTQQTDHSANPLSILLVDDDQRQLDTIARGLRHHGYTGLQTAGNGEQAMALLHAGRVHLDLVISDAMMPGLSGLELARQIKTGWPDLRVLIMSAYLDMDIMALTRAGYCDGVIQKPFTMEQLLAKISLAEAGGLGPIMTDNQEGRGIMAEKNERLEHDEDLYDKDEDAQKDKYLTFHLAGEDYGVDIKYVTEIIGIQSITNVPDMPDFVRGVINLRGKVIPVMDVRTRFKLPTREYDERTCIIVVDINETSMGLVVDEVREVADIPADQVEPPPITGKGTGSRYIQGMGKLNNEVKIILNVAHLLYDEELEQLKAA